jgi:hypothetical protein
MHHYRFRNRKELGMKREHVVPDLLASMTADALFAGKPELQAVQPAPREQPSIFSLGRWFKAEPAPSGAAVASRAPSLTLDDDWVGGWYARTRLLQAATLAHLPERNAAGANPSSGDVEGGGSKDGVDVVTQIKDFS